MWRRTDFLGMRIAAAPARRRRRRDRRHTPARLRGPERLELRDLLAGFPFTIAAEQFQYQGEPVFLNGIVYQPLEPGQDTSDPIQERRWRDDLRRLAAFSGPTNDPLVLRIPLQPTEVLPDRLPLAFYDGLRELDAFFVQDIFFHEDYMADDAVERGIAKVDAVMDALARAEALDRVVYFEIGNEFHEVPANTDERAGALEDFVCAMADRVRSRMSDHLDGEFTNWVAWASWPPYDPLRTDGIPVVPGCLDVVAYNAYPYDPERLRDHQSGPFTGTPYEGYIAELKRRFPGRPLVISETGLPDSPSAVGPPGSEQDRLPQRFPSYSRGGLSAEQVSEAMESQYWNARLGGAAGVFFFSWNDEWHKFDQGSIADHDDHPEEYFGMARFDPQGAGYELRYKLHAARIEELFQLDFAGGQDVIDRVIAARTTLSAGESTTVSAVLSADAVPPVRFRWETSRGRIVGENDHVQFFAGDVSLGSAQVTAIAIDAAGRTRRATTTVQVTPVPFSPPTLEILTLGIGPLGTARVSGRVSHADLTRDKILVAIETDQVYFAPYGDLPDIWVDNQGYWWTTIKNQNQGRLVAWLVPREYDPPATLPAGMSPPEVRALAERTDPNDADNDLLDDGWELAYLGTLDHDRYDDLRCDNEDTDPPLCVGDGDGANHLEEFLAGTLPHAMDNDGDRDGLADSWEMLYFRTLQFTALQDPDADGLTNASEQLLQTHPGRLAHDRDLDGLPDAWEREFFGDLAAAPGDRLPDTAWTIRDAYELALWTSAQPWQNPRNAVDVNGDSQVTPQDALVVINDLNARGARPLPAASRAGPPLFLDVSADNHVTPIDVLGVINFLNGQPPGEGESRTLDIAARVPAENLLALAASSRSPVDRRGDAAPTRGASARTPGATPGADPPPPFLSREPASEDRERARRARPARPTGEPVVGVLSLADDRALHELWFEPLFVAAIAVN